MKALLKTAGSCIIAAAIMMSMCFNVFALDNGTYEMKTVTHYLNPDTGKTDDGGTGNAELGEGMCRSAVYEKAVVEQTGDGVVITMRMLLYSNLSNIRFAVQQSPNGEYEDIQYSVIKESSSSNSADIQFEAPSADSYIQVKMYVGPMGRDVCFYWNCDTETATVSGGELAEDISDNSKASASLFTDISGHWAESAINDVVDKGLFSGTTEITFQPETEMTRGMFVTVLGRLSGEEISGASSFADVNADQYYSSYIAWANSKGIVTGVSDTEFKPDTPVTCEQAAAIIIRYADYKGIELQTKSISPSTTGVSDWAKDTVVKAGKSGIITKQNTNGYDYISSATRADIASMLSNFTEYYVN